MAYTDFKSYIQDKYGARLTTYIEKFINLKHDGIGFHSYNVLSVCDQKAENLSVKYMVCHDDLGPMIRMDIHCEADIVTMSLGTKKTIADRRTKRFTAYANAILANGLKDFCVTDVEEYNPNTFEKADALDEYLVPYIYSEQLEDEAEDFYEFYCSGPILGENWVLPVGQILGEMGIEYYEAPLPDDVFGRMYFNPAFEDVYEYDSYMVARLKGHKERRLVKKEIKAGTMLINSDAYFMGNIGSELNTMAHEIIHWDKHQKFFEILALLDEDQTNLACAVNPEMSPERLEEVQKAIWWAEWQANALAPRILMPRTIFLELFRQIYEEQLNVPYRYLGDVMENTLEKLGKCFGVSRYAAKVRALQLGIMEAEGTFLRSDKFCVTPISFRRGALGKNQTYAIDRECYERLLKTDGELANLILEQQFVYAECFVVVNDPLYVEISNEPYLQGEVVLTDYAREHADECCLKFERQYKNDGKYDVEFYGQCYLSKKLTSAVLAETKLTHDLGEQNKKDRAQVAAKLKKEGNSYMQIMRNLPTAFSGTFDSHMKRVKKADGKKMTNLEMSIRTGLSEDYIAKLRKEELNVTLETVCALCIGLHLPPCFSRDMVRKSRNEFALNETGYFQSTILEEMYMEPLEDINALLREQDIIPWGKV